MTTETNTLSSFLLARIAEDEAVARTATEGPWVEGIKRSGSPGVWRGIEAYSVLAVRVELGMAGHEPVADAPSAADAAHIARHDHARVLAECAAKRAIVDAYEAWDESTESFSPDYWAAPMSAVVEALASIHSDHQDYREEWRP